MTYKVLGQAAPVAATATDVYTAPAGKTTVVSTLAVTNTGAVVTTYRVAVRPAGAVLAAQQYIAYDKSLAASTSDYLKLGITLSPTDVITVYATLATLSFSVFGDES